MYKDIEKKRLTAKKYRQSEKGKLVYQKAGKRYYLNNKEKRKQIHFKNHQENKLILHGLKINGCAICGYNKCDAALQFHHVNSKDKKFCITADTITNKNLVAELSKCMLLCANCHREKHQEERDFYDSKK